MTQRTNAFPELDRDLRFIPLGVDEPRVLTPGQICRYNEAGHLFPIDIFSPGEIAELRAYIDDLLPRALAAGWGNYQVVNWYQCCRGIWDIVTDSRISTSLRTCWATPWCCGTATCLPSCPATPSGSAGTRTPPTGRSRPAGRSRPGWAIDDTDVANSAMQVIPTPDNASSADPVRDASLSH